MDCTDDAEIIRLPSGTVTSWHVPADLQLPLLFELRAHHPVSGEGAYVGRLVDASAPPGG